MTIQENISLKNYNTFGIDVNARFFVEVTSLLQLQKVLGLTAYPKRLIISGGSNILLTNDIDALVIHLNLKGIAVLKENSNEVQIKVMAGENWHQLVLWTLNNGYGGLENLSLIPGNAGTAPIQNIGAYGVELKDIFISCEAMETKSGELVEFDKDACQFGYRDSIFKNAAKDKYIITSITLKLSKQTHTMNTSYGAIEDELQQKNIVHPTLKEISDAVISIRSEKLPDPKRIGNSGSFFKNPIVPKKKYEKLLKRYATIPCYQIDEENVKIPAGWLIEQCGFKGKRFGDAGVHENQALVLVNYGSATGIEILRLAQNIQDEVHKKFKVAIVPEVNIIR
ncbi:MAG: UDP-N-acetylmuramate dehydrogenase [Bacteroidota bacterium]